MEGKESLERIFAQLSDEQKERFRNRKDTDEVMKPVHEENVELTDDQPEFPRPRRLRGLLRKMQ